MSMFTKAFSLLCASSFLLGSTVANDHWCKERPKYTIHFEETCEPHCCYNDSWLRQGKYHTKNDCGEWIDHGTFVSFAVGKTDHEEFDCDYKVSVVRLFGECGFVRAVVKTKKCDSSSEIDFYWGFGVYECWDHTCKSRIHYDCDHGSWSLRVVDRECCHDRCRDHEHDRDWWHCKKCEEPRDCDRSHEPRDCDKCHEPRHESCNKCHESRDCDKCHESRDCDKCHEPRDCDKCHEPRDCDKCHESRDCDKSHEPRHESCNKCHETRHETCDKCHETSRHESCKSRSESHHKHKRHHHSHHRHHDCNNTCLK